MTSFKCFLIGDAGPVRKTFVKRLKEGGFTVWDSNAQGVKVHSLIYHTTLGPVEFSVWELDDDQKVREGNRVQAECAFIIYDDGQNDHMGLRKAYESLPTVLCGTKASLKDVNKKKNNLEYYYNIEMQNKNGFVYAFLWIATKLLGDNRLKFVPMPAMFPANCKIDKERRLQVERDLEKFVKVPLPQDDGSTPRNFSEYVNK